MTHDFPYKQSVTRNEETTLLVAEAKSFAAFDEWMDGQLEQLIAQWIHTAAPNASRIERMGHRFSRQAQ